MTETSSAAMQAAIAAVHAAVERLAQVHAAEAPERYTGTASYTVLLDRHGDAPEELVYLSDPAAVAAGYPAATAAG